MKNKDTLIQMKKITIHMLKGGDKNYFWTECGLDTDNFKILATNDWKNVNCKRCKKIGS